MSEVTMKNPLMIPEVVEHLANKMEWKQAMGSRLVCKLWNEEVIAFLRKIPQKRHFKPIEIIYNRSAFFSKRASLPLFVDESEIMDLLLSNLRVIFYGYDSFADCNKDPFKIQQNDPNLLIKYGMHVSHLTVRRVLSSGTLIRLLTELCPNVTDLEILKSSAVNVPDNNTVLEFPKNTTLSVENFTFLPRQSRHFDESSDVIQANSVQLFSNVLQASPKLQTLKVTSDTLEIYIPQIQMLTELTHNLVDFQLIGNALDNLNHVNNIQFSAKLKNVSFDHTQWQGIKSSKENVVKEFLRFLWTNGQSLRKLEFKCIYEFENGEDAIMDLDMNALPDMPEMVEFNSCFSFQSFEVIKKMPNLDRLILTRIADAEEMFSYPIPKNQLTHLSLQEHGIDFKRGSIESFHRITAPEIARHRFEAFPMVTEVSLEMIPPQGIGKDELTDWFTLVCQEISQLVNLRKLAMSLSPWDELYQGPGNWWYSGVNLDSGFNFLKNIPNLETLYLGQRFVREDTPFPRYVLLNFIEAPKLKRLRLVGLNVEVMDRSNLVEVATAKEFFEKFSKSSVKLHHKVNWIGFDAVGWIL